MRQNWKKKGEKQRLKREFAEFRYELDLLRASDGLGLSKEFIPLDSFEGEVGFFYNKQTEEVFQFSLNGSTENTTQLATIAKWDTFNLFLDWYL